MPHGYAPMPGAKLRESGSGAPSVLVRPLIATPPLHAGLWVASKKSDGFLRSLATVSTHTALA